MVNEKQYQNWREQLEHRDIAHALHIERSQLQSFASMCRARKDFWPEFLARYHHKLYMILDGPWIGRDQNQIHMFIAYWKQGSMIVW